MAKIDKIKSKGCPGCGEQTFRLYGSVVPYISFELDIEIRLAAYCESCQQKLWVCIEPGKVKVIKQ